MPKAADMQQAAETVIEAAKIQKGIQSLRVCRAYVDPTSYTTFSIREDILAHFEIDPIPDSLTDSDVPYAPRKKAATTTATKNETIASVGAGSYSRNSGRLIGKAIKIPCGTGLTRNFKGKTIQVKEVTVRVPSSMSDIAICLWINTCFKQASKKPGYFKTASGGRVDIISGFTNKATLPNKKSA